MTVDESQLAGRVLAGRYRIGPQRGAGAQGMVFEALDIQQQRLVALKLIHPRWAATDELRQRFLDEVTRASAIKHPNINRVLDFGIEPIGKQPTPYLVLEHLAGGSLRDMLDRGRLLSPSQGLTIGLEVCRGLDAMHRHGLAHRDIRPSSLVFGEDRHLRIIDAGVAGFIAEQVWVERSAVGLDTASYSSPEQAQGPVDGIDIGSKSDIYSLCLVLVEAVTGQLPFVADSTVATLTARVDRLMPVSADLGPLASVLERAGRPHAEDRYTAAEFGQALVQIAEKLPRPAPIPIVGLSGFGDPTGGTARPAAAAFESGVAAATAEPTAMLPTIVPSTAGFETMAMPTQAAPLAEQGLVIDPDAELDSEATLYDQELDMPRSRGWVLAALLLIIGLLAGGLFAYRELTKESFVVPVLAGLDEGVARNKIDGFGWELTMLHERSDQQPQGHIIRTEPAEGATIESGGELVMVVSDGPTLPRLPEVTSLTLVDATALLQQNLLAIAVGAEDYHEDIPAGTIISWSVPAQPGLVTGMEVVQQTVVAVVVSRGPAPRDVPQLANLDQAGATTAVEAVQLTLTIGEAVFSDTVPAGQVVSQLPAALDKAERGSTVTVQLSKGVDLVVVPSMAGLDFAGVQAALVNAGFALGVTVGDPTQPLAGLSAGGVAVTEGQQIRRGTPIDITYPPPPTTTTAAATTTIAP